MSSGTVNNNLVSRSTQLLKLHWFHLLWIELAGNLLYDLPSCPTKSALPSPYVDVVGLLYDLHFTYRYTTCRTSTTVAVYSTCNHTFTCRKRRRIISPTTTVVCVCQLQQQCLNDLQCRTRNVTGLIIVRFICHFQSGGRAFPFAYYML